MRLFLVFVLCALFCVNGVTFLAFFVDKRRAIAKGRRVPERTLLTLCALCGATGGIVAMRVCHHKTHKPPFPFIVPLLCLVQWAALGFFMLCL